MAALGNKKLGLIDHWLQSLRDVRAAHKAELAAITDEVKRVERLVELNVIAQVNKLKRLANVQEAIRDRGLEVHGFVYDVASGLADTIEVPKDSEEEAYELRPPPMALE
jgi:carbonic anhydrase